MFEIKKRQRRRLPGRVEWLSIEVVPQLSAAVQLVGLHNMILTFCYLKDTILQTRNKLMSAIEKFTLKAINVVSTTTPYRSRMETKNLPFILIDQKGTETPLKGSTVAFDGRPGSSSNSSNNA